MDFVYWKALGTKPQPGYKTQYKLQQKVNIEVMETNRTVGCMNDCVWNEKYLFKEPNKERN